MVVMGNIITLSKPYRIPTAYEVGEYGNSIPLDFMDAEYTHYRHIDGELWAVASQKGSYWDRGFKPYKVKKEKA